ncbi:hypothetical protein BDP27DRAFT_1290981 [Rhodocollybia butyracea]|uniref:Macro domain-containing protein n=1 Tax=Rhodocollybia butyracea TaxID=206335 RepID=A0A9P5Q1H3_9AGAR|nr:hypothetical protein BDP27DRAFT_1290981 [Rhodocollybia butyracea]
MNFFKFSELRTISQLYKTSVLKAPSPDKQKFKPNSSYLNRITLFQGDITKLEVDSIVNAANKRLLGGGGVDGAIHAAAGRKLYHECTKLNGCETGFSKITGAYRLPSKKIIHTVGPVYSSTSADQKAKELASCYQTSLDLALENSLRHIAFPSVSTGIYGYPIEDATHIALNVVRKHFESEDDSTFKLDRVVFVVWSNKDKSVYESLIPEYFPPSESETNVLNPEVAPEDTQNASEESQDVPEESQETPVPESQIDDDWEEVDKVEGDVAENGTEVEHKPEQAKTADA